MIIAERADAFLYTEKPGDYWAIKEGFKDKIKKIMNNVTEIKEKLKEK